MSVHNLLATPWRLRPSRITTAVLLLLALAVCCGTATLHASAADSDGRVPVNANQVAFGVTGSSYLWTTLFETPALETSTREAIEKDVKAYMATAAGGVFSTSVFTVPSVVVNNAAMFAVIQVNGPRMTSQMSTAIFGTPLTTLDAEMDDAKQEPSMSGVQDFFPSSYAFYEPLPLRTDNGTHVEDEVAYIQNYTSSHAVFISGPAAKWEAAVEQARSEVASGLPSPFIDAFTEAIVQQLETTVARLHIDLTPDSFTVMEKGKLMRLGDGYAGVTVDVTLTQEVVEDAGNPYGADGVTSLLYGINISGVIAIVAPSAVYKPATGWTWGMSGLVTPPNEDRPYYLDSRTQTIYQLVSVRTDGKYGNKCTGACIGMIVMGSLAGAIMIGAIIVSCVCVRCFMRGMESVKGSPNSTMYTATEDDDSYDEDSSDEESSEEDSYESYEGSSDDDTTSTGTTTTHTTSPSEREPIHEGEEGESHEPSHHHLV